MCKICDINSTACEIFQEPLTGEWYWDIRTTEWDKYDDGWVYQREYIGYCPFCGRKLGGEKND